MSRTKHRQRTGAQQWNPPPLRANTPSPFDAEKNVLSATECTGLTPQPVMSEDAGESLSSLYAIHEVKPQGNVGKCNPNNDPSEIDFHRQ